MDNNHDSESSAKTWDVFISHASEDKENVAIPLANELKRAGLRVWLDSFQLSLGDSLREKIEEGLSKSRFGVVIISSNFLSKRWTTRELNGLMTLEEDGQKVILPIWHRISKNEIIKYSPILADRLAANTVNGISAVVSEILDVVFYQSNRLSQSLTGRLIELINSGPVAEDIAGFLFHNHKILSAAFSHADVGQLAFDTKEGYIFFGCMQFTPRTIDMYVLAFSSSEEPIFEDGSPTSSLLHIVEGIRAINLRDLAFPKFKELEWPIEYKYSTILTGRRDNYNDTDRIRLQELNQYYKDERIRIRSYDWLIDACLKIDK